MSEPFGARLGWGSRPALLLVDVVAAYLHAGSPLDLGERGARALAACVQLLVAARSRGITVVHTRVAYTAGMADAGTFGRKVPALRVFAADADSEMGAIAPELTPRTGEVVVTKQYASAFFGTSLAATLTAGGVDTVVVGGFSTSGCVRASATDALQHGFVPIVVSDACGDRTAALHEGNLFDLDAKYADVVSLDEAVSHLTTAHLRGRDE
ncbi:MAG: isochorismatase family protein [Mycobacteriaceae bacterium]